MSLNQKDKTAVRSLWAKVSPSANVIGEEALGRLLIVYPQTKIYFSHWNDLSLGSAPVKKHGKNVMGAVAKAVDCIDDLNAGMQSLSELHAFKLRVDPANFKLLAHCIMVVISTKFPVEFTPEAHMALDKFLTCLALALSEKYR
ncbi:hemoglobin, alpha embryonic 5 [Gouania willdenowi]|uniref:Hemoglobin subunit alpha-like n=1 Tax=Gouania willdenowi TaxID=441366 RepID=A0A8C5GGH1_GOUWI|nr:hemoglobin subunit alpha-like [Gouania willdenowi]